MSTEEIKVSADEKKKRNEKLVDLFVPRGSERDEPNQLIGFNGKNWLLPRGKASKVPVYIQKEYERSLRARERLEQKKEELLGASK